MSWKSFASKWLDAIKMKEQALGVKYPRWRRRNYLVNQFQTKYAVLLVVLSIVITVMVGVVMYKLFSGNAPESTDIFDEANVLDRNVRLLIAGLSILVVAAFGFFFVIVILASHRIAGPLFVMGRYMSDLSSGKYPAMRPLRKNDELKEFFAQFKTAVDRLRERETEEARIIEDALESLSPMVSGPKAQEALRGLRTISEAKRKALQDEKPSEVKSIATSAA
jgi:hypothetical protein